VTAGSSLFDYAPGTSTDTFTLKSWPLENPPCVLPQTTPVKPVSLAAARRACEGVIDRRPRAHCVFDVQVTGERGFAKTYLLTSASSPAPPPSTCATIAIRRSTASR
jgi:hypothetical protein